MKLNRRTGLAGGILAAAVLALTPAAFAANVVKVDGTTSPPGAVSISGGLTAVASMVTNFGVPIACTTASLTGTIQRGSTATAGTQIGSIASLAGSPCTATTLNYPLSVSKRAVPSTWGIFVKTTPTSKTQQFIDVEIRNILMLLISPGSAPYPCHFELRGTIQARFDQINQRLIVATAPAYPLVITAYDSTGGKLPANILPPGTGTCVGQFETGDTAKMSAIWAVSTPGVGGIHLN